MFDPLTITGALILTKYTVKVIEKLKLLDKVGDLFDCIDDSFTSNNQDDTNYKNDYINYPSEIKITKGNCEKCNSKFNLEISQCCSKKLCFNCNRFNKGSYCRMCHLA